MNPNLEDIERAIQDGSIDRLDKATLEGFARVIPRTGGNPAYHLRVEQAQRRVDLALARIETREKDARDEARHTTSLQLASSANHIAKWAIVLAIFALIISVIQTFWW